MALDALIRAAWLFPCHQHQIVASQETIPFAKGKQPLFVQHQEQQATYGVMALQRIV